MSTNPPPLYLRSPDALHGQIPQVEYDWLSDLYKDNCRLANLTDQLSSRLNAVTSKNPLANLTPSALSTALGLGSVVTVNTLALQPTGLNASNKGLLFYVTDYHHLCLWNGTAWVIVDDPPGTFIESAVDPGTGWQLCNGGATTYLVAGASLTTAAFTTPDETTAPSGVYHKSIAAYTGVINAAVAPAFSGTPATLTGSVSAPVFTGDTDTSGNDSGTGTVVAAGVGTTVATHTHTHDTVPTGTISAPVLTMNSYTPAGTVAATAQPRNLGVLVYFRR